MGSYSQLTISGYPIYEEKNLFIQPIIDLLFTKDDYIEERRKNSARNKLVYGDEIITEKGTYIFKGFKQTVGVCKKRIEIYGINKKNLISEFKHSLKECKLEFNYPIHFKIKYDEYLNLINDIIVKKEKSYTDDPNTFREFLTSNNLGYGLSLKYHLFSILNTQSNDDIIEYDLTEIFDSGWTNKNEILFNQIEKIIILTEGKTDVEFLKASLNRLYPFLNEYYHFINFDEFNIERNASALVKLVKSFAAANIQHPIIALFDNDTTGIMEMNKLKSVRLNSNIRILKYPDLKFAQKYPTIGPNGMQKLNINGFACSIEMYFGMDILTIDSNLIPVQWKGFNEHEKKYQGEIQNKKHFQEQFRMKLKTDNSSNFEDMDLLLNEIFQAFSK